MAARDKVSLTLQYEIIAAIDAHAQQRGLNRSSMINLVLREWVAQQKAARKK